MVSQIQYALDRLSKVDRSIAEQGIIRRSLEPSRACARGLAELGELLMTPDRDPRLTLAFADALCQITQAFAADFPENAFWDLDYLAARLWLEPSGASMGQLAARIVAVSADYGQRSPIAFRYAHDFLYGFDWCRWLVRDVARHATVGPFDAEFLVYLDQRQRELLVLIANDDAKYAQLPEGTFRNPFRFSREPSDEIRLHRVLVERGLVPVEAWSTTGRARWNQPFSVLREAVASELGMARRHE